MERKTNKIVQFINQLSAMLSIILSSVNVNVNNITIAVFYEYYNNCSIYIEWWNNVEGYYLFKSTGKKVKFFSKSSEIES